MKTLRQAQDCKAQGVKDRINNLNFSNMKVPEIWDIKPVRFI